METGSGKVQNSHPRRAALKLAATLFMIASVLTLIVALVSDKTINGLVNHLTLGLLVVLIVIANLLSLVIGLVLYNVYRGIKQDLDPEDQDF